MQKLAITALLKARVQIVISAFAAPCSNPRSIMSMGTVCKEDKFRHKNNGRMQSDSSPTHSLRLFAAVSPPNFPCGQPGGANHQLYRNLIVISLANCHMYDGEMGVALTYTGVVFGPCSCEVLPS